MQKIVPNLWFDHNAAEAAAFYASVFPDARVTHTDYYPASGLPDFQAELAGKELTVEFEIGGYRFIGINAGPEFPINPSLSFMVTFDAAQHDARERLDALWAALSENGRTLMPLQAYDFSPYYGWVQDRYGVSWQLGLGDAEGEAAPFIMPTLLFGAGAQNRAEEALEFYADVFPGARSGTVARYPEQTGPAPAGALMYADLELFGQRLAVMDSSEHQDESFTCGVSLMIECADQAEIDRYWGLLSTVPEAEQCGWCADQFGVSWQVVPERMDALLISPEAFQKMMGMKKIVIAELAEAG